MTQTRFYEFTLNARFVNICPTPADISRLSLSNKPSARKSAKPSHLAILIKHDSEQKRDVKALSSNLSCTTYTRLFLPASSFTPQRLALFIVSRRTSRKPPLSQYLNIILATGLLILLSCFPPYFLVSVTIVCIGCRLSICYEMNSCIFSMELHNIHFSCGIKNIFCPSSRASCLGFSPSLLLLLPLLLLLLWKDIGVDCAFCNLCRLHI